MPRQDRSQALVRRPNEGRVEKVHGGRKRLSVTIAAYAGRARSGLCFWRVSSYEALLREPLDGEGSEPRILVADFARLLELIRVAPCLRRIEAVERTDGDASPWRRPLKDNDFLPGSDEAASGRLDRGLRERDILLLIRIQVADADFRHDIGGRAACGGGDLNSGGADRQTRQQGKSHLRSSCHRVPPDWSQRHSLSR